MCFVYYEQNVFFFERKVLSKIECTFKGGGGRGADTTCRGNYNGIASGTLNLFSFDVLLFI